MQPSLNRRSFMGAAAAGAFAIVPRHVLGGPGNVAPSEKITLAQIGFGTQAVRELGGLLGEPKIQIVAVCDPNADTSDYVEWGKGEIRKRIQGYIGDPNWRKGDEGCPGGRDVGRAVVDGYYARQRRPTSLPPAPPGKTSARCSTSRRTSTPSRSSCRTISTPPSPSPP